MQQVKIYTASPSDLSPPVQSESFCVDLVLASDYRELEAKCAALVVENGALKKSEVEFNDYCRHECEDVGDTWVDDFTETPATDAFLAEMRAQAHKEGAYFVANRMLAAWDAGFIDDTAKNAADIARMILTSTEFMADAPEGDFDRSFADGVIEDIAAQLRKGGNQ
ncbi:ead/Ea22-like family protein [Salmonella enterica subsp. enterica serovar Bredeney]|nr:ead/Ea22-like family protein [Salmonella enterica subsp. enterica serovar Haifa]ECF3906139.1 ead/Ea22-like family protein [Salmonella enterica subsp. enterica serovar Saintpaul]ECG6144308.1 ead/Ea22-like family protein [Salmonella enterica subsp. enterica]ECV9857422.1 ead/Ea22-like family protein [Salmonella enterica subsp. enterica serovar Bredeney]EDV1395852.1 ead/Ea22-like family protein [Salmonella enterica subsp. enterica serovar Bredeney]